MKGNYKYIAAAAIAGIAGAGIGVASAGGAPKAKTVVERPPAVTTTVTDTITAPARTVVHTKTAVKWRTVTDTVTHTVTTTPTYSTGSWPTFAEESFVKNSIDAGLTQQEATCQLKYIETHVSYDGWIAAQHDIAIGSYPSWYQDAGNNCNTG